VSNTTTHPRPVFFIGSLLFQVVFVSELVVR
jgi:hypothetical protein